MSGSIQIDPSSEFLNIAQGDSLESNEQIHLPFSTSGKERVTGAVSVIDPSKLFKNDSETDVSEILRGRIPGKMNGLNLRGVGEALVVIDGLPRPI